jgi:hypothetical protein
MNEFNYKMLGELYSRDSLAWGSSGLSYRRFATVAEAIRFAMEDMSAAAFAGCTLEAGGERFGARELRELYASPLYPLQRSAGRMGKSES